MKLIVTLRLNNAFINAFVSVYHDYWGRCYTAQVEVGVENASADFPSFTNKGKIVLKNRQPIFFQSNYRDFIDCAKYFGYEEVTNLYVDPSGALQKHLNP
jgi:hypothetical protein